MTADGQVKDRRYHLRKYKKCVVGRETIDWLLKHYHVQSREEAIRGMQILQDLGLIHHVVDEHDFKDEHLFYRFTYDDESFTLNRDLASFYRGIDIYRILKSGGGDVMRDMYHKGILYKEAFYGSDAVDCVTAAEYFPDRDPIIKDFRDLLEKDIIKHVTDDYHFSYDRLIYEFNLEFQKPCLLHDVIDLMAKNSGIMRSESSLGAVQGSLRGRGGSRSSRGHDSLSSTKNATDSEEAFEIIGKVHLKGSKKPINVPRDSLDSGVGASNVSTASNSPPSSGKEGDDAFSDTSQSLEPRSVLIRPVTLDELEDPEAPVVKRFIQVRQFISHINGLEVIRLDHKEVAHLIAQYDTLNLLILMHRSGERIS
ncbi:dep domain-containing mtor-interacting protein-like [Plakobranchus ocellatus]|uniref:Dep domain-containing mtor-interacting protein-like n=1 Tax=Plakobranchus ocellatus TaxID=259542 RepID=A0AAV3ZKE6_9GAST|nr:dep domain-containing mtor-interacting protein-like [Plakobranchus ocellatus]